MDDFIYICDDAYQQQQFIAMESRIMRSLGFDVNIPIPYRFLRRYAKVREFFTIQKNICDAFITMERIRSIK